MEQPILAVVALLCAIAAGVWGRSALRFQQSWQRTQAEYGPPGEGQGDALKRRRKEDGPTPERKPALAG